MLIAATVLAAIAGAPAGWWAARVAARSTGAGPYPRVCVPAATILSAATGARFGLHAALPAYVYLAALGVALSATDVAVRRLPNALVLPAYPVLAALLGVATVAAHDGRRALHALVGMAAYYGLFLLLRLASPRGLGFGDVKLAGVLGLALGWLGYDVLVAGYLAGAVLGGVVGLALIAGGRVGRSSALPYGPFMVAGAFAAILLV